MRKTALVIIASMLLVGALVIPGSASAHCDTLDGPAVKAAQTASGDVNLVLAWVQADGEAEVRQAFQKALTVRKLNPAAKELADTWFFETVVRVHRAGEGAPYTGLKPAGQDFGPAIPAADRALETGRLEPVDALLSSTLKRGLEGRFHEVMSRKAYGKNDVTAGRAYVKSYVTYLHYVEGLYNAASGAGGEHHAEGGARAEGEHHAEGGARAEGGPGAHPQRPGVPAEPAHHQHSH